MTSHNQLAFALKNKALVQNYKLENASQTFTFPVFLPFISHLYTASFNTD